MLWGAVAALVMLAPAVAAACNLDGLPQRIESANATLAYRAEPPLTVGEAHVLEIGLCPNKGDAAKLVAVDAFMPAHQHGTNYRIEIAPSGTGRFFAKGLLLHMPGAWELRFDVETAAGRERLTHEVEVE
jgi:hypothetical protein